MQIQKIVIYTTLLIEVLGISIIIPAFPELKTYYGIGDFQVTLALATYSLCAFLAAPILGQLSDKLGRKKLLAWCIAGTSLSYFVALIQPRYWVFLITRMINGTTGGNVSIIQAILTDFSKTPEEKNKSFGIMGALFGLGFIIGPVLGSLMLTIGGVNAIFWFGGIAAGVQFLLLLFYFTNSNKPVATKKIQYNAFRTIKKYITRPSLSPWLWSFMFLGIGGFILNAGQALYMFNEFGTTGIRYGYYLAILGVVGAINMGILVPQFWTKKFSTKSILLICFTAFITGYVLMSLMQTEVSYITVCYIVFLFSGAYGIIYQTQVMSQAAPDEVGELSGMFSSMQSIAMGVGPLIAGLLLESAFNMHWGSVVCFVIAGVIMIRIEQKKPATVV